MFKLLSVESCLGINSSLPTGERPLEQSRTVEGGTEETESGVGNEQVTRFWKIETIFGKNPP